MYTVNVTHLNHLKTISSTILAKNCLPWNRSLVPRRLGTTALEASVSSVPSMQETRRADTDLRQVRVSHITGEWDADWPFQVTWCLWTSPSLLQNEEAELCVFWGCYAFNISWASRGWKYQLRVHAEPNGKLNSENAPSRRGNVPVEVFKQTFCRVDPILTLRQ